MADERTWNKKKKIEEPWDRKKHKKKGKLIEQKKNSKKQNEDIRKKKEENLIKVEKVEEEGVNKIKDRLRAEEKYYRNRIVQEFDSMSEIKSGFLEDLEKNISLAQGLLQGYTEIFSTHSHTDLLISKFSQVNLSL